MEWGFLPWTGRLIGWWKPIDPNFLARELSCPPPGPTIEPWQRKTPWQHCNRSWLLMVGGLLELSWPSSGTRLKTSRIRPQCGTTTRWGFVAWMQRSSPALLARFTIDEPSPRSRCGSCISWCRSMPGNWWSSMAIGSRLAWLPKRCPVHSLTLYY